MLSTDNLNIWQDESKLYANTILFYVNDLGIYDVISVGNGSWKSSLEHQVNDYVYVPHAYSSTYGNSGCFHVLTITNNADITM